MVKSTIWTLVVIVLLSYAFVPVFQTSVNNLIGIGNTSTSNDLTKEYSEKPVRCSEDNLSEYQFFIFIFFVIIGVISAFYAGYQYHKKHTKVSKNGRPTKGINKD